jgi:hypothetical protein
MQLAIHVREQGSGIDGLGKARRQSPPVCLDHFTIVPAAPLKRAPAPKPSPVQAKRPAATPPIDKDMLLQIYRNLSANGRAVTPRVFGTELSVKMPNYKKGHRTLENFLRNSGVFKIERGVILPLG